MHKALHSITYNLEFWKPKKTRCAHFMRTSHRFLILKMYFHFHLHRHEYSVHGKEKIVYKALVVFQFQLMKLYIKYHCYWLESSSEPSFLRSPFHIPSFLTITHWKWDVFGKIYWKIIAPGWKAKVGMSYKINVSWMIIECLQSLERRVRYQLTYSSVPVRTTRAS